MEGKELTVSDVIKFFQEQLQMGEDLDDPDATTPSGEEVNWEKDILSPQRLALAKLEQGDPSDARMLLDNFITNCQRARKRPGHKPTEYDQKHLEKLEALRRTLD